MIAAAVGWNASDHSAGRAIAASFAAAVPISAEEENVPPVLAVYLMDEDVPFSGQSDNSSFPVVLKASTILLNEAVLDQINPHEKKVSEMPVVNSDAIAPALFDYEPDEFTQPVVSGTGRLIAFDMKHTGTEPRQVFVHENVRLLGDFNGDGNIGVAELLMLLAAWCEDEDCCKCCAYDLNGDGKVDVDDLDILLDNWG